MKYLSVYVVVSVRTTAASATHGHGHGREVREALNFLIDSRYLPLMFREVQQCLDTTSSLININAWQGLRERDERRFSMIMRGMVESCDPILLRT